MSDIEAGLNEFSPSDLVVFIPEGAIVMGRSKAGAVVPITKFMVLIISIAMLPTVFTTLIGIVAMSFVFILITIVIRAIVAMPLIRITIMTR